MGAIRKPPIRILTAVPICDGHDSAINTINREFVRSGIEVIYLGYHRAARDIVRAAIQEDVRAIGISSYNGGHVEFFSEVIDLLRKRGADDIGVFGGGGGTITPREAAIMMRRGVERIFPAGTPLAAMVDFVTGRYAGTGSRRRHGGAQTRDRRLARALSLGRSPNTTGRKRSARPVSIGFTGPGGAGKTTLIDELVLRLLIVRPRAHVAILSHDPTLIGKGALLGDRATMIYSQDDRVFMRSLGTHGRAGGLARETSRCLRLLQACEFDAIFVETAGTGQEAIPFGRRLVDKTVFVTSPEYGSRL